MDLNLKRFAYMPDRTMGALHVGTEMFYTLERPWISSPYHRGGVNFESCVPDGEYILQPFSSANHPDVWSLHNTDLDVYVEEPLEGVAGGRWVILIHVGNYIKDIVGCIAAGLTGDERHVWNSAAAIERLRKILGDGTHRIIISPKGATN